VTTDELDRGPAAIDRVLTRLGAHAG
jgi:hypothetical protein